MSDQITFDNVSRFYGEVLGVNRVTLSIPPGITSLVGPNGSGKTTLMNLITGLVRPTCGEISVLGISPNDPEQTVPSDRILHAIRLLPARPDRHLNCCLRSCAWPVFRRRDARNWRRVRLNASASPPRPTAKSPATAKACVSASNWPKPSPTIPECWCWTSLSTAWTPWCAPKPSACSASSPSEGRHVIVSSHVLHEVDLFSDQVILLSAGYVVAEGQIRAVRGEIQEHPMQVLIRCDQPSALAARVFAQDQ